MEDQVWVILLDLDQKNDFFAKKHPFTPKFNQKSPHSPLSPLHPEISLMKIWG